MSYYWAGQEVDKDAVQAYNDANLSSAKKACKDAFVRDLQASLPSDRSFVYVQNPNPDYLYVYMTLGVYGYKTYETTTEHVDTETSKETEYYTSGYSGTIDGDTVTIHEDIDSYDRVVTTVTRVYQMSVTSEFYYVVCDKNDVNSILADINCLAEHHNGYENYKNKSSSPALSAASFFTWFLAFLESLLTIYFIFPTMAQTAVIDLSDGESNIFAFSLPHAPLFWPLFVVSIFIEILVVISALELNKKTKTIHDVKFIIASYIAFPVTIAAFYGLLMLWKNVTHADWISWVVFLILLWLAGSSITQFVMVMMRLDVVRTSFKNSKDVRLFRKKFPNIRAYEQKFNDIRSHLYEIE